MLAIFIDFDTVLNLILQDQIDSKEFLLIDNIITNYILKLIKILHKNYFKKGLEKLI